MAINKKGNPLIDFTGKRFGKLVPQWPVGKGFHHTVRWLCLCDCGKLCVIAAGHLKRNKSCGCETRPGQFPGQSYTFQKMRTGEKDSGVLPLEYGLSNEFASWRPDPEVLHGGYWRSRKFERLWCSDRRYGRNPQGLLGRMSYLIKASIRNAKEKGYKPYLVSPERMLQQWKEQQGKCRACGLPLELLKAAYDHNHETGEGRGFLHQWCNCAEGHIRMMSDEEFRHFVLYVRPNFFVNEECSNV